MLHPPWRGEEIKMRVYLLAERSRLKVTDILKAAKKLGMRKKYAISNLTDAQAKKIKAEIKKKKILSKLKVRRAVLKQNNKKASGQGGHSTSFVKKKKTGTAKKKIFIDMGPAIPAKYNDEPAIPAKYNDETLVIMPRDPACIFAYWEISRRIHGYLVLRVYEMNKSGDKYYFDTDVEGSINNWYVKVPHPGKKYRAEIGYMSNGIFTLILSSNIIDIPSSSISDEADENWMIVKEDLRGIIKESGLDKQSRSSLRQARSDTRILFEILKKGAIGGSSSSLIKKK